MLQAKVIGTATATLKHRSMDGLRLLVVQPAMADGATPDGEPLLAIDVLGAARGATVIITSDGRLAQELTKSEQTPVRWSVVGISDK